VSIKPTATTDTLSLTASLPNKYPISVGVWVNIPSTMGVIAPALVSFGDSSDDNWDLELHWNGANWNMGCYSSGGSDVFGAATIPLDTWHSLFLTISAGGAIHSYLDGVLDINAGTASSAISATTLQVGHSVDGNIAPFSTSGTSLYSVKIYNAELTAGQVLTEVGCDTPILTTNLYDCWLINTVGTAGTANNNGHTFTTVTGFTAGQANPTFTGCGGGAVVTLMGQACL
jgi:hypothetical protein